MSDTQEQFARTVEELQESQRKWLTLIHNLPGAVYRFRPVPDSDKIVLEFVSEGAQQITGYPLEELIQKNTSIIHPDDRESVEKGYGEALEGHKLGHLAYRLVAPDGAITWVPDRFTGIQQEKYLLFCVFFETSSSL